MSYGTIIRRPDGSYVINDGMYHVPNNEEFSNMWASVDACAKAHPENVTHEAPPAPPTQEERDAWRVTEIKGLLAGIDAKSARPLRAVIAETATDADRAALAALEAEAQSLREELAGLEPAVEAAPAGV